MRTDPPILLVLGTRNPKKCREMAELIARLSVPTAVPSVCPAAGRSAPTPARRNRDHLPTRPSVVAERPSGKVVAAELARSREEPCGNADAEQVGALFLETLQRPASDREEDQELSGRLHGPSGPARQHR